MRQLVKEILYRIRGEYTTEKLIKLGLSVGNNFKRLHGVILDPSHCWLITIGDNVTMAPRVHVLAHDASTCFFLGYAKIGRVNIGSNAFIGADSVILPNVTIGDNVIVGANSIVTKNLNENSVYAGNPAKYICSFDEFSKKHRDNRESHTVFREYEWDKWIDSSEEEKENMYNKLKKTHGYL